jgi:DivIVA domain-containing protein
MIYVTGERLHPHHIRVAAFDTRWRGLDPEQVHVYLNQIADEIERLRHELTTANTEAERICQALRQWQSRHTDCRHAPPGCSNSRWRG